MLTQGRCSSEIPSRCLLNVGLPSDVTVAPAWNRFVIAPPTPRRMSHQGAGQHLGRFVRHSCTQACIPCNSCPTHLVQVIHSPSSFPHHCARCIVEVPLQTTRRPDLPFERPPCSCPSCSGRNPEPAYSPAPMQLRTGIETRD
jgi:hypothetical protein